MILTSNDYIQSLGNLLSNYHSDLIYIRDFHRFKLGKLTTDQYVKISKGSFKSFINEFRVARNIDKLQTHTLLDLTTNWLSENDIDNVDVFASRLKESGITRNMLTTSLASKILFLNNPWKILPIDSLARRTIGNRTNKYSDYLPLIKEFIQKNNSDISATLKSVSNHLESIESQFINEISDLEVIRLNRFVDKILWTVGAKMH